MQKIFAFASIMLATAAMIYLAGCKDKGNETGGGGGEGGDISVGIYLSLSGDNADFGITTKNGVELAIEEINKTGGVKGKKLKPVYKDTASKPEEAGTVARQLVSQDKVAVAIGSVESGQSLVAAPIFQEAGVPMVSPSSTNPLVTQKGDRIFRVCYLDDFQGAACAAFAFKDMKAKKAAILAKADDPYSTGLAQFFKAKFEKLGGKIVSEQDYRGKLTDFSTQVSNIKPTEPEVVFVPVYYGDIGLIAKEFRKQGVSAPLLGGDGWESPQLVKLGGTALEGCYFGYHYNPDDQDPKVQAYIKAYREKFKDEPNSLSALGYDAVYVIKAAIEKEGDSRDGITKGLRAIKGHKGVTGTFDIDANRNARKPISMLKIGDNKLVQVRQVMPEEVE